MRRLWRWLKSERVMIAGALGALLDAVASGASWRTAIILAGSFVTRSFVSPAERIGVR